MSLRAIRPDAVRPALLRGGPANVDIEVTPKFRPGDRVSVRNEHPTGHTRMPRYCRGRTGVIDRDHGVFVFPDTHALGQGKKPQHCYSVRFPARELWGVQAPAADSVYIDLWDDYLDAAP
jgi:nitrile hydratase